MAKFLTFFTRKNNILATIIILLILGLGTTVYFQHKRILDIQGKHLAEVKLNNALNDSVSYYINELGEEVAEKLTLQATVGTLEDLNDELTTSEKELVARIKAKNKDNSVITAALIEAEATIDSLMGSGTVIVDPDSNKVTFTDTTKFLTYDIEIGKVKRSSPLVDPTILFKNLTLPNKQFIEFHWMDNKKEGYPIEFSVSNSSPYYKTYNINSYAIPELQKEVINPNGWQKVGQWFKRNGKTIVYVGAGAAIGAGGTYVLMK